VDTARLDGKDSTHDQVNLLRAHTIKKLQEGWTVIYAWCYSIYALFPEMPYPELTKGVQLPRETEIQVDSDTKIQLWKIYQAHKDMKVKDIVKDQYAFADPANLEKQLPALPEESSGTPESGSLSPTPSLIELSDTSSSSSPTSPSDSGK